MSDLVVRGVPFRRVWNASGARGFSGEGYWFHSLVPGLDYSGSTFVAKTTTLMPRAGNMPLDHRRRPVELLPRCVVVKPFSGVVLNSVGLSGPGLASLLDVWGRDLYLGSSDPWMVSIMSVDPDRSARLDEIRRMCDLIRARALPGSAGIQVNISCPNVGLDPSSLALEASDILDVVGPLGYPVFLKVNVLFPVDSVVVLSSHPFCGGFICSNTIPWGKLPDHIDWAGIFGSKESPLADLGGGGLSGKPLLPLVLGWILSVREADVACPLVGGGGILDEDDAEAVIRAGADAVELGSVSILRPWRVSSIISRVNAST